MVLNIYTLEMNTIRCTINHRIVSSWNQKRDKEWLVQKEANNLHQTQNEIIILFDDFKVKKFIGFATICVVALVLAVRYLII